jgi:hypothetical protein
MEAPSNPLEVPVAQRTGGDIAAILWSYNLAVPRGASDERQWRLKARRVEEQRSTSLTICHARSPAAMGTGIDGEPQDTSPVSVR